MSEFASMLDSFKRNAARTNVPSSSSTTDAHSSRSSHRGSASRKNKNNNNDDDDDDERGGRRPITNRSTNDGVVVAIRPPPPRLMRDRCPSFPRYHHDVRMKRSSTSTSPSSSSSSSFELSFLVIGAQKAGTTWLHSMLRGRRSRISLPRRAKELHFWDWHHRNGYDWYVDQFLDDHRRPCPSTVVEGGRGGGRERERDDDDDECECDDLRQRQRRPILYGEITPCYVVLPPDTIAEIKRCHPNIKLVFIARDLVDRAWSAMIMELRDRTMGMKPGEFANGVVDDDEDDVDENLDVVDDDERRGRKRARGRHGDDGVPELSSSQRRRIERQSSPSSQSDEYFLERLRDEAHASRSDYASHLRHWYDHFPPENVLLVDYRDIVVDPRSALRAISKHVGLDDVEADVYVSSLGEEDLRRRVNAAEATSDRGGDGAGHDRQRASLSRRPNLERRMREYLRPYARDFNALLAERGHSWRLNE